MKKQSSFAYLHENIDENKLNDPLMKKMPILKNIGKKNLIPVIDFESFNQSFDKSKTMQTSMNGKTDIAPQLTVNYLMVYLSGSLRCLSQQLVNSALFTLPSANNEEMAFYSYPNDKVLDFHDLKQIIYSKGNEGTGKIV